MGLERETKERKKKIKWVWLFSEQTWWSKRWQQLLTFAPSSVIPRYSGVAKGSVNVPFAVELTGAAATE